MLARCRDGTEVHEVFRLLVASITVVLAACTVAAQSPAMTDPVVNEVNRRTAICNGDPLDFLDNRDYCLRIGDWTGYDSAP
jgi:prophage DNA circulation protein